MEQRVLDQVRDLFALLKTEMVLLDQKGSYIVPAEGPGIDLPDDLIPGQATYKSGKIFFKLSLPPGYILTAPESVQQDILVPTAALVESLLSSGASESSINSAYQRMLQNELSIAELDAAINEYKIPAVMDRCVLLMHMVQVQQRSAYDILAEILPQSPGDVLVSMDRHTAAFIKNTAETEGLDEYAEFASAVQETLLSEMALTVTIGIGETAATAAELHQSYRQARRAIEIGRVFQSENTIYVYRFLMLERFLSDLPSDTAAHYHGLLFNRKTARLFNDEMLYTIEMFFKKDLNLSDAARQLYIHRNTLVYRLDKVQRQVGLDLRKFNDAVTFKMLLEMKKCSANKMKKTI